MNSNILFNNTSFTITDIVHELYQDQSYSSINNNMIKINSQIKNLPRKAIALKSMANSKLIFINNDELALQLINEYGPEHFIICTKNEQFYKYVVPMVCQLIQSRI